MLVGYGNPDREDDGVAWHILDRLARRLLPCSGGMGEETWVRTPQADMLFSLQLMPEMAEILAQYRRVCFIDAHTGAMPQDLYWAAQEPEFQASPFTHHMTASTLLSITETLYHRRPHAVLVAVRGYQFGFERTLSTRTEALAKAAEGQIWSWLHEEAS